MSITVLGMPRMSTFAFHGSTLDAAHRRPALH